MAIAAEKQVEIIIAASDHASKTFDSIKRSVSSLGSGFSGAAKSATSMAGNIAKSAAYAGVAVAGMATAAGYAAGRLGKSMLESAGGIEQQTIAFQTLTGSAEEASKIINQIVEDSKATPFEFSGLARGTQMLMSADVSAQNARDTILDLGDAIAATGGGNEEFGRVVQNLQQIKNVGNASAVDIKQFGFAGINISKLLAESMGKTTEAIGDMVSAGEIGFEDISEALNKAASEGGVYFEAMKNQSTTLFGLLSTFKDTVKLNFAEIANQSGLFDSAKSALNTLITAFENNKDRIIQFAKDAGQAISSIISTIGILFEENKNRFYEVAETIKTTFSSVMEFLQPLISLLAENFKSTWKNIVDAVNNIKPELEDLAKIVGATLVTAFVLLTSTLSEVIEKISEVIKWSTEHKDVVIALTGAVTAALVPIGVNLVAAFGAWAIAATGAAAATIAATWPIVAIAAAIAAAIYVFQNWDTVVSTTGNILSSFGSIVSSVFDSIISGVEALGGHIRSGFDVIIQIFTELKDKFFQMGKDLIDGLINGIKDKIGEAKDTVTNFANDISNSVKGAFRIQSPSKVFKEIGNFLVEGLIEGVQEKRAALRDEMTAMAKDTASQLAEQIVKDSDQLVSWQKQLAEEEAKTGDQRNQATIDDLKTNISLYQDYFSHNKYLLIEYGKEIADVRRKQGMTETDILKESLRDQEAELKKSKIKETLDSAASSIKDVLQQLYDAKGSKKNVFEKLSDSISSIKDLKSTLKELKIELKEVIETANADYGDAIVQANQDLADSLSGIYESLGSDIADKLIDAEKKVSDYKDDLYDKQKDQAEDLLAMQEEHAEKRAEIEKLLALNLTADQKSALQSQLSELETSQTDELAALKSKQSDELAEIQSKIDEENALLEAHADDYTAFADAITEARRIASLDSVELLKEQFAQEKSSLYEQRDAAIQAAKDERDGRIAEVKTEISETRSLLAAEIENRNTLFKKATEKVKDQLKEILKSTKTFISDLTDQFQNIPDALADAFSGFADDFATAAKAVGAKRLAGKGKSVSKANSGGVVTSTGVRGFSNGGVVPGPISTQDTVPAMLTPGEIVLNPAKGQGMGQKIEVYFMNPTVRSDSDMNTLIRVVDDALSRKLKLSNQGV